jgi:hypothetical protein
MMTTSSSAAFGFSHAGGSGKSAVDVASWMISALCSTKFMIITWCGSIFFAISDTRENTGRMSSTSAIVRSSSIELSIFATAASRANAGTALTSRSTSVVKEAPNCSDHAHSLKLQSRDRPA